MLLKWLFTILAILWLYQAIRPFFDRPPGPPTNGNQPPKNNDEGEYIDYEEIK